MTLWNFRKLVLKWGKGSLTKQGLGVNLFFRAECNSKKFDLPYYLVYLHSVTCVSILCVNIVFLEPLCSIAILLLLASILLKQAFRFGLCQQFCFKILLLKYAFRESKQGEGVTVVSKYGVISGPYFPLLWLFLYTGK